jgi:hypothetical protein
LLKNIKYSLTISQRTHKGNITKLRRGKKIPGILQKVTNR